MPRHSPWGSLTQQKTVNSCWFIRTDAIQVHIQSWVATLLSACLPSICKMEVVFIWGHL